jgi:sec-independent protein translocase protein TatC
MGEKAEKEEEGGPSLTFMEHLHELRRRLWYGLVLLSIAVVAAFIFRSHVMKLLMHPFLIAWTKTPGLPKHPVLNYANPVDPFFTDFKLAILAGLFLGLPLVIWQVWLFISPGLYRREKKYVLPFLVFSYFFLALGGAFCYYVVLPTAFQFFLDYAVKMGGEIAVNPTVMIKDYAGLSLKLMIGFGVVFQLPLVIVILTLLGLVNWKFLLKISRWVVVGVFVVAAVLTPTPDVVNQTLMAVPMLILYYASVLVSFFLRPVVPKAAATGKNEKKKKK